MNDFDKKIIYIINTDQKSVEEFKKYTVNDKNRRVYVIIKNDAYEYFQPQGLFKNFDTVKQSKKYILLVK